MNNDQRNTRLLPLSRISLSNERPEALEELPHDLIPLTLIEARNLEPQPYLNTTLTPVTASILENIQSAKTTPASSPRSNAL